MSLVEKVVVVVEEEALLGKHPPQNGQTTTITTTKTATTTTTELHLDDIAGDCSEKSNGGDSFNLQHEQVGTGTCLDKNGGSEYTSTTTTNGFFGSKAATSNDNTIVQTDTSPTVPSLPTTKEEQIVDVASSSDQSITEHGNTPIVIQESSRQQDAAELYLDKVYQKSATQEFYCPNCNSCIKKVLLRSTELETSPAQVTQPVDTFRCTSCFSFLIPAGNWFFSRKDEAEMLNDVAETASTQPHDSSTIQAALGGTLQDPNGETPADKVGTGLTVTTEYCEAGKNSSIAYPEQHSTKLDQNKAPAGGILQVHDASINKAPSPAEAVGAGLTLITECWEAGKVSSIAYPEQHSAKLDQDKAPASRIPHGHDALINKAPSPAEAAGAALTVPAELDQEAGKDGSIAYLEQHYTIFEQNKATASRTILDGQSSHAVVINTTPLPLETTGGGLHVTIDSQEASIHSSVALPEHESETLEAVASGAKGILGVIGGGIKPLLHLAGEKKTDERSKQEPLIDQGPIAAAIDEEQKKNETKETEVPIEENLPGISQIAVDVTETTLPSSESRPRNKWDILKSIVYGGLIESITSLCVVTSAASSGASTLSILALALANLIGGLFIIGHNLWDLISEQPRGASNETDEQTESSSSQTTEQVDRYQELLGQRQNFKLHATVALLSFLIFGLVPPVVYAFSFRESEDKDYKLAAVAAASLLCIAILGIGKAHIKMPQKYIKTVMYYVIMAVIASGLSYIVGGFIKKLIEELGWLKSEAAITLSLADASSEKPSWAS